MHPFPPTSELEFLIGKELQQVSLGYWSFSFSFDAGNICVEGDLEHIDSAGVLHRHNTDGDRLSPLYLHHLLGQSVQQITVEPLCLTLQFNRGDRLRIFSDEGQFECGQIYSDNGTLIVF
jgi:hypothetical protein